MPELGKLLTAVGAGLMVAGLLLWLAPGSFRLGRLSGDIFVQKGNMTFSFPVVTCVLLSVLLSGLLWLFRR